MHFCRRRLGFSLIELLSTIAIILILAAILFPVGSHVRKPALDAKTKARLSQHILALEQYFQEYGYFPTFLSSESTALEGAPAQAYVASLSLQALGGEEHFQLSYNPCRRNFYQFAEDELKRDAGSVAAVVDAYGESPIHVMVDVSGAGVLRGVPSDVLEKEGNPGAGSLLGSILMYTQGSDGRTQVYCYQ